MQYWTDEILYAQSTPMWWYIYLYLYLLSPFGLWVPSEAQYKHWPLYTAILLYSSYVNMYIHIPLSALKLRDTPTPPCIYTPPPSQFGNGTLKKALQPKRCANKFTWEQLFSVRISFFLQLIKTHHLLISPYMENLSNMFLSLYILDTSYHVWMMELQQSNT